MSSCKAGHTQPVPSVDIVRVDRSARWTAWLLQDNGDKVYLPFGLGSI